MSSPNILPMDPLGPPRRLVARACDRFGEVAIVQWCIRLLLSEPGRGSDPDITWLGGQHGWDSAWSRVWAARALSYIYLPEAATAIGAGLRDDSWRVQEMACNVVGAQGLTHLRGDVERLVDHQTERVNRAAARALAMLDER